MLQLKSFIVSHRCVPSQEIEEVAMDTCYMDTILGNVEDTANHIQATMTQR